MPVRSTGKTLPEVLDEAAGMSIDGEARSWLTREVRVDRMTSREV